MNEEKENFSNLGETTNGSEAVNPVLADGRAFDPNLAFKLSQFVHDNCKDVRHDIGIRLAKIVSEHYETIGNLNLFFKNLKQNQKDMPEDIAEIVSKNFWELI